MKRRKRMLADLEQDIREHIERETQDNIDRGMPPEEARYAAVRKFGNITRVKEDTREVWTIVWLDQLLQDIHYGLRMLARSPGFAAAAILTLALGIGANTAIFSLIDAVMFRALPVSKPSQLMVLKWAARNPPNVHGYLSAGDCPSDLRRGAANPSGCSFSEPWFRGLEKEKLFSGVSAFGNAGRLNLSGNGPPSVIEGQLASGDFFRTLGVKAALGRVLEPGDDALTAAPVAVLNYGYWQSAFGGAPGVVGRTIELNNVPFTVVGVAEQRFTGIAPGSDYDVWLALAMANRIEDATRWENRQDDPTFWWLTIVARPKTAATIAQTQAAVSGFFQNETLHGAVPLFHGPGQSAPPAASMPAIPEGGMGRAQVMSAAPPSGGSGPMRRPLPPGAAPQNHQQAALNEPPPGNPSAAGDEPRVTLLPAQTGLVGDRRTYEDPLYVLMLAVGIVLLIACANVAGLMLARGTTRQKEMAVRLALGAGRTRVMRQLLTESLILSALGGVLGVFFAYWGAHSIVSFVSSNQPRPLGFATGVDLRVLIFTAAVSLLTGVLFGIAPAFRGVRVDLAPALKQSDAGPSASERSYLKWFSMKNTIVVAQVALAMVVLVGAGLLVRTLANLRSVDVGFDSHNILVFQIDPTLVGYKGARVDSFYRDLQGRLSEIPGIKSASYSMMPLLSNGLMITAFHWPGAPEDQTSEADVLGVGPDFFATLQIPFLTGREFAASDFQVSAANESEAPSSAPTPVIVNQAFVQKYLGKENPIGKQFGRHVASAGRPANAGYQIIGVVRDAKYDSLRREIHATIYTPQSSGGAAFELRTAADPAALLPAVREAVAEVNTTLPLFDVKTESEQIDRLLFQERLVARLSTFFALLALVLACIGLYGLLSYEVSRRTREIGIRVSLGAQPGNVMKLVLRQGLALAVIGVALGVGLALGFTRYMSSLLFDVQAGDPVTLIVMALLLTLVALAACYIPARRATRVDPLVALRYE